MKRYPSWHRVAVLCLAALTACDAAPTASAGADDTGRQVARELGLDAGSLQDFGSYWLAEGDAASVMNGMSAGTEWAGLSFFDRVALVTRYPDVTTIGVSNSGGQALVSWSAVTGATGYTAELVWTVRVMDRYRNITENAWEYPLTSVTTTSALDTNGPWTGTSICTRTQGTDRITVMTQYRVTAIFPAGTTVSEAPAPVASC